MCTIKDALPSNVLLNQWHWRTSETKLKQHIETTGGEERQKSLDLLDDLQRPFGACQSSLRIVVVGSYVSRYAKISAGVCRCVYLGLPSFSHINC